MECAPGMPEALGSISEPHKLGVVTPTCTIVQWEVKAGGSEVQDHETEVSLGYRRLSQVRGS